MSFWFEHVPNIANLRSDTLHILNHVFACFFLLFFLIWSWWNYCQSFFWHYAWFVWLLHMLFWFSHVPHVANHCSDTLNDSNYYCTCVLFWIDHVPNVDIIVSHSDWLQSFQCIFFWFNHILNVANHCSDTLHYSNDSCTWFFDLIVFEILLIVVLIRWTTHMNPVHVFFFDLIMFQNAANHCFDILNCSNNSRTCLFDLIMFQMLLIIVLTRCMIHMIPRWFVWFDHVQIAADHCSHTLHDSNDSCTWFFDLILGTLHYSNVSCAWCLDLLHQNQFSSTCSMPHVTILYFSECFMIGVDTYIFFQVVQYDFFWIFNNYIIVT